MNSLFWLVGGNVWGRFLSFGSNLLLLRRSDPTLIGQTYGQLEPLLHGILLLREPGRLALGGKPQPVYVLVNHGLLPAILVFSIGTFLYFSDYINVYQAYIVLAAFLELMIEPCSLLMQTKMNLRPRVQIEAFANLMRCFIAIMLTMYWPNGILLYCISLLVYGACLMLGCLWWMYGTPLLPASASFFQRMSLCFKPKKVGKSYFKPSLLSLSGSFILQTMVKGLLTEGDKLLLLALSFADDQGLYAFVTNLGSVIARILFQPLEEMCRLYFSNLLSPKRKKLDQKALNIFCGFCRLQCLLGGYFIFFAPYYTPMLVHLLFSRQWSSTLAPNVLAFYCYYVPIMGLNGISEAFLHSLSTPNILKKQSFFFMVNFIGYSGLVYYLLVFLNWGVYSLILANMLNMVCRICYCFWYFQSMFKVTWKDMLKDCLPQQPRETLSLFLLLSFIMRFSASAYSQLILKDMVIHLMMGVGCFLVSLWFL